MSEQDKLKWNEKYAAGAYETRAYPANFLADKLETIKNALRETAINAPWDGLDLACGAGRNSHFLATQGFRMDAVDISEQGLQRAAKNKLADALPINWVCQDLENSSAENFSRYHLILMMRYVNIPLLRAVTKNLVAGGLIICEEHLKTDEAVIGPKNPNFRVAPGALKDALSELNILHYSESIITEPNGDKAAVARILAQRS